MKSLTLNILVLLCSVGCYASVVTEEFLDILREIESSGGKFLYGDNGKSLGPYQMSAAAWADVDRVRSNKQLPLYPWKAYALDERISREYARAYCLWLEAQLNKFLRQGCSAGQVYAAYNAGIGTLKRVGGNLSRLNPTTRSKCLRYENTVIPVNGALVASGSRGRDDLKLR